MSETTPKANDHGPAPVQMSPEQAASLGLTPTEPALVPADQGKPEGIATLKIEYRDGKPLAVISDGAAIPAGLSVVDASGAPVATYVARRLEEVFTAAEDINGVLLLDEADALFGRPTDSYDAHDR
ncbi:hypothetical protein ACWGNM_31630 [Streptomyces sp. NPDC055796]